MSINVTVSGNPISIKRGKMVTTDPNHAKKEFEKRRLMRLEQVRQQSKDIAEDVRNKVRKEKKKQMSMIEEEGKQKLKSWQNRKLLDLQTQYKEALQEFGLGHKEAEELQDESELLMEQKLQNEKVADVRGQIAATKLQVEKNKENYKKCIPIQQKKLVRDIENTRASMVSNMKKKKTDVKEPNKIKKRKKASADINITIPDSESESGESVESEVFHLENVSDQNRLSNISEEQDQSQASCDCTEESGDPRTPLDFIENDLATNSAYQRAPSKQFDLPPKRDRVSQTIETRQDIDELRQQSRRSPPPDTRISDRIKRRDLMASQVDYCDTVAKTHPMPFIESSSHVRDAIDHRYAPKFQNIEKKICVCGHKCESICQSNVADPKSQKNGLQGRDSKVVSQKGSETHSQSQRRSTNNAEEEIPAKLPVKVKETYDSSGKTVQDSQKVQYYDHQNRFSQQKVAPGGSHVERITNDSLEVMPNVISEAEWYEKMRQRDRDAQIRGQKALEKERIQKDYEEMLKKLPILQKKERICEITKDKPEYHMSEERLKERERRKQNEIDNAYNKLFPNRKPAIVTIPSKLESVQSLNVGKWDVDHEPPRMFSAEEVQEIIRDFTGQQPCDRQSKLKHLLRSLKLQKQQLINEIKLLPEDSSINELINDLNSVSDSEETTCRSKREKSERKRRHEENEKETSTDSTTESSSSSQTRPEKGRQSKPGKTPSPRKKVKIKPRSKILVLQNMSTQTTPKVTTSSENSIHEATAASKQESICDKTHAPCVCNKENESTEEVCQIVIRINNNEEPQVVVVPKEKESKTLEQTGKTLERSTSSKKMESRSVCVGTEEVQIVATEKIGDRAVQTKISQAKVRVVDKKKSHKPRSETIADKVAPRKDRPATHTDSSGTKSKSWREQLSKNSMSTSSTSYLSPPDFQKTKESQAFSSYNEQSPQSFYNLHKKPQQENMPDVSAAVSISQSSLDEQPVDPRLLSNIKRLLSMSRVSIENLTVSTSSVQTPSQSVVEIDSNNPMAQLHNIIKYVNYRANDLAQEISVSSDASHIHYNSSASPSDGPHELQDHSLNFAVDRSSKSCKTDCSSRSGIPDRESTCSGKSKDSVLAQYADITDSCSKRIATLAAMIQQIREEKQQMLQNPPGTDTTDKSKGSLSGSDKEFSTRYLDPPEAKDTSSKQSSIESTDEDEVLKKLMEIDLSLANKLRKFGPLSVDTTDIRTKETTRTSSKKHPAMDLNETNKELWLRLQRLTKEDQPETAAAATNSAFVPFLTDIPMLPKLEAKPENGLHKHPPPSKGLTVAKKFNGDISLIPHELSTIVEADSQISTKVGSSRVSPNTSKTSQGPSNKDLELIVRPEVDAQTSPSSKSAKSNATMPKVTKVSITTKKKFDDSYAQTSQRISKSPSPVNSSSDLTTSKSITLTSKNGLKLSSSSSDDLEDIEAMLKSIGMGWAIPTLHKTQKALALASSSSSSLDLSAKKKLVTDTSGSEISLKQFLSKQIKISSSTLRTDASPSLTADFSEVSAIQANTSEEKVKQRTSTPITTSKSTDKSRSSGKKVEFSAASDISSVRDESTKHSFHSLSEYSQSKNDE